MALEETEDLLDRFHDGHRLVEWHRRALQQALMNAARYFDCLVMEPSPLVGKFKTCLVATAFNQRERRRCVEVAVNLDARLYASDARNRRALKTDRRRQ